MKTLTLILTTALLATAWLASPARAGWTNDPFNGMVTVCNAPGDQSYPELCPLAGGNTCVVWRDSRTSQDTIRAFYQILNPLGMPLIETNGRPLFDGNWQYNTSGGYFGGVSSLISDGVGGCIITVRDRRDGTWDVWGQRIDSVGNRLWGPNGMPLIVWPGPISEYVSSSCLTSDSLGNFFVSVYIIHPNPYHCAMAIQKLRADGLGLWGPYGSEVRSSSLPNGADYQKSVPDMQGGLLECWVDYRLSTMTPRIYFQHLNSQGQPLLALNGIPVLSLSGTPIASGYLDGGVPDGSGGGIWSSASWIYLWRLDGMGHMRWSWVNTSYQGVYSMIRHPSDGTIWFMSSYLPDQLNLFRFTVNGQPLLGPNGVPYGGRQLVHVSNGVITVHYNGYSVPYEYAQRIDSTGTLLWRSSIISIPAVNGSIPCSDGSDGIVVGLTDARYYYQGHGYDIAAQRVNTDGRLGAPPKHQPLPDKTIENLSPGLISFVLDQAGELKIELYDILGRKIALIEQGWREAGAYKLKWNDEGWASGVYLLRMEIAGQVKVRKVAVVR
jgi:hypothetical protein